MSSAPAENDGPCGGGGGEVTTTTTTSTRPGETETTVVNEWTEEDGTRVIRTEVTTRTAPNYNVIDAEHLPPFERQFLDKHNEYRAMHGVPPLIMSRDLCEYAQEWADTMARTRQMTHRPSPRKYGESLFAKKSSSMRLAGDQVVSSWYERGKQFPAAWYGIEPPAAAYAQSGNFTQIIWRSSQRLGVGVALAQNCFYVVANYDPPGNCITKYAQNLQPPKAGVAVKSGGTSRSSI